MHELPGFKGHRLTLGRALPATTSVGGSKQDWRARPPWRLWSRLSLLGETPAPAHSASLRAPLIGVCPPSARFWVEKVANPHIPYTTQSRNHQPTPRHQTPALGGERTGEARHGKGSPAVRGAESRPQGPGPTTTRWAGRLLSLAPRTPSLYNEEVEGLQGPFWHGGHSGGGGITTAAPLPTRLFL